MTTIHFVSHDGARHSVEATPGITVMQAARDADLGGIIAECGGGLSCATCHVVVDPDWYDTVGAPDDNEEMMLDFAFGLSDTSRLSCQVVVTEALEGLVLHVPEEQG